MTETPQSIAAIVIGCGAFARRYHVPTLTGTPGIWLAAIIDPTPSEATVSIARANGAALLPDIAAVGDIFDPVMAVVSSPHALHAFHVAEALERKWNVLCDKPFVLRTAEAETLADAAERDGRVNAVAFNRRLDRGCLRAREAIRAGAIGEVCFCQTIQLGYENSGWFIDPALGGGGPFTGRGTHLADFVPWLIDRVPDRVRGRIRGGSSARVDDGGFIEVQFGGLECHHTCVAEGLAGWDEIRIFGSDGLIELRRPLNLPLGWEFRQLNRRGQALEWLEAEAVNGASTRAFVAAMRGQGRVSCTFREAWISVAIIEAAFASARDGGWIDLPRPPGPRAAGAASA